MLTRLKNALRLCFSLAARNPLAVIGVSGLLLASVGVACYSAPAGLIVFGGVLYIEAAATSWSGRRGS